MLPLSSGERINRMGKIMRDPAEVRLRSSYSNSVRGKAFAADIATLRVDVCAAAPGSLHDSYVVELIARAARLRRRIADDVGGQHRAQAFLALDIFCTYLCGITAEEADREERVRFQTISRKVPPVIGSARGGPVVSGGLPTLGFKRR